MIVKRCLIILIVLLGRNVQAQHHGTAADREALFDYIYERTLEREAFSPLKEKSLNFDPRKAMLAVKEEVVQAKNDIELYYALQKLSAARKDRHLSIDPVKGGLVLPEIRSGIAPLRFHPDFQDMNDVFFFVSDVGLDIKTKLKSGRLPEVGDRLTKINGENIMAYVARAEQYIRYSNRANFLRRFAYDLTRKSDGLPPSFFQETLTLTLKPRRGKEYTIELPYMEEVSWTYGRAMKNYKGYEKVVAFDFESFELYRPTDPADHTLLLWWYGFRRDLPKASDALIAWAEQNNALDYDLIIDAIDSRGGSLGAYALARLSPKAFKTTGGNLKLSDITDDFIADYTQGAVRYKARLDGSGRETIDNGTWVMDWLHGPVMKGLLAGQEYSNNAPFKCAHLPYYSDWIMQPAEKHFTGKMVVFFGPWGGSHLSQFSAMIYDNDLGYTMGMPDGGYSNTWEWEEDLVFPTTGKPVIRFMWNIGHTIRPNGQILEGNPAPVHTYIPVTRDNYLEYKNVLLKKAQEWLGEQ